MKLKALAAAALLAGMMPLAASAQGLIGGAQQGAAEGSRAAGPIGGVVGGAVGAGVGAASGAVSGVLGVPQRGYYRPARYRRAYHARRRVYRRRYR